MSIDTSIQTFKLILIGDSGVGKSSLLTRYVNDVYNTSFMSTIGIDFKVKTIELEGKKIKLQIWDTAGQERFRKIVSSYYRGAQGIAFVFDLTDSKSFNNLAYWISDVKKQIEDDSHIKTILIGTKADLIGKHPDTNVNQKYIHNFLKSTSMPYVETSANTGIGVNSAFEQLAKQLLDAKIVSTKVINKPTETIKIAPNDTKIYPKNNCC